MCLCQWYIVMRGSEDTHRGISSGPHCGTSRIYLYVCVYVYYYICSITNISLSTFTPIFNSQLYRLYYIYLLILLFFMMGFFFFFIDIQSRELKHEYIQGDKWGVVWSNYLWSLKWGQRRINKDWFKVMENGFSFFFFLLIGICSSWFGGF